MLIKKDIYSLQFRIKIPVTAFLQISVFLLILEYRLASL